METEQIQEIDISKITVNPNQPRRHFGKEELEELAESIKSLGLIQPPVVRWSESRGCYELIAGERRFRASCLAGLEKIPVIIKKSDACYSAEAALVENIQRVDLSPMEIARALQELKQFGVTQEDLESRVGKKRSTIANYLRLLDLPSRVQLRLEKGELTMGHAKAILSLESPELQEKLADEVVARGLSVRETEQKAGAKQLKISQPFYKPLKERDVHLDYAVEKTQERFGTKVVVQGNIEQGKLTIDFFGLEDLERILNLMGVKLR